MKLRCLLGSNIFVYFNVSSLLAPILENSHFCDLIILYSLKNTTVNESGEVVALIEARWSRGRRIDLASCDWLNAICFLINFLTMGCWLLRYLLSFQRRTMNYSIYGPSCGNFFFGRNDFHQRPRSLCNIHFSLHSNCNSIQKNGLLPFRALYATGIIKFFILLSQFFSLYTRTCRSTLLPLFAFRFVFV